MIIKNAVILVTGGASNDYGRATVEKLLQEGANVIICDLPTKDLIIYGDDKAIFLPINTNNENDVKSLMDVIKNRYGRLDGVVNCTDELRPVPLVKNKEPHCLEDFTRIIHENLHSVFNITRLSIPLISCNVPKKNGGRGIIINMSHSQAFDGDPGYAAYAASKAAVAAMTEAAHGDLHGVQIRCFCIVTGAIKSEAAASCFGAGAESDEPKEFACLVKQVIEDSSTCLPVIRVPSLSIFGVKLGKKRRGYTGFKDGHLQSIDVMRKQTI